MDHSDTIYALSTPPGKSGLAIVRCSGSSSIPMAEALTSSALSARSATFSNLRSPTTGLWIDQAIVIAFPGPGSFTGEDLVEFHIHGSRAVISALTAELTTHASFRPAEPGEFTRRAFENGKLDFTQIEGLVDLIEADTSAQRLQALAVLDGKLSSMVQDWRSRLIRARAHYEAGFDFSDEGDIDDEIAAVAEAQITSLHDEMVVALSQPDTGPIIRDGLKVAIVGLPNAGKSTLFNALAGSDIAITSPTAGTTRDVLSFTAELGGMSVTLFDTAGLRETSDGVEQEGILRAKRVARDANLVLHLVSPDCEPQTISHHISGDIPTWRIRTKSDIADGCVPEPSDHSDHDLSCLTGDGMPNLIDALSDFAESFSGGEPALLTRDRHRKCLDNTARHLKSFLTHRMEMPDIRAENLRQATDEMGRLIGLTDAEDLLEVIFSEYCIGK